MIRSINHEVMEEKADFESLYDSHIDSHIGENHMVRRTSFYIV